MEYAVRFRRFSNAGEVLPHELLQDWEHAIRLEGRSPTKSSFILDIFFSMYLQLHPRYSTTRQHT